jgi:hypothetical protein
LVPRAGPSRILFVSNLAARRRAPRLSLDGFCGVAGDHDLGHASMSDLSTLGLLLERPFDPATARPVVQLEIELPGIDEVVWTSARVTRAFLTPMGGVRPDGQPRFWCRAGLVLGDTSRRERRLLRDYVVEQLVARDRVASFV